MENPTAQAATLPAEPRRPWWRRGLAAPAFLLAKPAGPLTYGTSRWWFLRLLGACYLVAFISLWVQVEGLLGARGILPASDYLEFVGKHLGAERYWRVPTFSWLAPRGGMLHVQCAAGAGLAMLLLCNVVPRLAAFGLWALYLSLSSIGREFLGYQWDVLLLETGFAAVFLAPGGFLPGGRRRPSAAPIGILWVLRFLLFKLMFSSGLVKLLSGDPAWHNLTALNYHYQTQPLPSWAGWYAHQLPAALGQASVVVMFGIELVFPWLIFAPRRLPIVAAVAFTGLMFIISITGNYCFFNLLTVALCLLLVDDDAWRRIGGRPTPEDGAVAPPPAVNRWRWAVHGALAGGLLLLSGLSMLTRLVPVRALPGPAIKLLEVVAPLRTFNSYGLFAVMTTTRNEIVVEGSDDGLQWLAYEFKWKPGDLRRVPGFVAPHQPRLDWQMWFAALGRVEENPWFQSFLARLLQGSPPVLDLLARNPFPAGPPRYVRAVFYEYQFTNINQRRQSGEWWRREKIGMYCTRLSLRPPTAPPPAGKERNVEI